MNRLLKIFMLTAFIGLSISTVAQRSATSLKLGYVNTNDILILMPERKQAETSLQSEARSLEDELLRLQAEYQALLEDYQSKQAIMTDAIKQSKINEITDKEKRITEFQMIAQESLQQKEASLLEPIITKVKDAVKQVSEEKGYTYVFDASTGVLLFYPESDDITDLVKTKLGLGI